MLFLTSPLLREAAEGIAREFIFSSPAYAKFYDVAAGWNWVKQKIVFLKMGVKSPSFPQKLSAAGMTYNNIRSQFYSAVCVTSRRAMTISVVDLITSLVKGKKTINNFPLIVL